MYKCNECDKPFKSYKALGGHSKTHSKVKHKTKKQIAYELNPKLCKECNNPIPYLSYTNLNSIEFCSVSCRAKHFYKINPNNLSKKRQIEINIISEQDNKSL